MRCFQLLGQEAKWHSKGYICTQNGPQLTHPLVDRTLLIKSTKLSLFKCISSEDNLNELSSQSINSFE